MFTSCPHVYPDDTRCDGELEIECEEVDNGDGVWAESGLAFWLPPDEDGNVYCTEGHKLTPEQVAKVEARYAEDYYKS